MQPTEEEIKKWQDIAKKRNAILPIQFQFLSRKEISITCGNCQSGFTRPMIVGEQDPIYVCPSCSKRNYIPINWNVIRRK